MSSLIGLLHITQYDSTGIAMGGPALYPISPNHNASIKYNVHVYWCMCWLKEQNTVK